MKKINNKGFTLVELIATVVILSLVVTIGAISITTIIKNAKEKDYELLIKEIKNATEEFYIECNFSNNSNITCPAKSPLDYYYITLGDLVANGFLKGNSVDSNQKFTLVNPKDNVDISSCQIRYQNYNHNFKVEAFEANGSCPTSY